VRLPWRHDRRRRVHAPVVDRAEMARGVRRIELKARRLMDAPALGVYESVFRGHGIEFSEVREYQPGDPFQSIDWKVTARMRHPFVKRFVEERELTVLLVVDMSASTMFGTKGKVKRQLAAEVAGILTLAAMRSQDRVGLLMFTDHVERFVPPMRGRNRALRLIYELLDFEPEGTGTNIPLAIATATRLLPTRSLIFVISDFETSDPLLQSLLSATRRHDVVALDIKDPAETKLPDAGLVEIVDPETGERRILDLGSASARDTLTNAAKAEDEELDSLMRRSRVDLLRLWTNRPYAPDLARFFAARARWRRW